VRGSVSPCPDRNSRPSARGKGRSIARCGENAAMSPGVPFPDGGLVRTQTGLVTRPKAPPARPIGIRNEISGWFHRRGDFFPGCVRRSNRCSLFQTRPSSRFKLMVSEATLKAHAELYAPRKRTAVRASGLRKRLAIVAQQPRASFSWPPRGLFRCSRVSHRS